jgi:hypothetical protein
MQSLIIGHQGWGDFFTQNALYNHYIDRGKKIKIAVIDEPRRSMMSRIFYDRSNAEVILPVFINAKLKEAKKYIGVETCVICHTNLGGESCPREPHNPCKYIHYDHYEDHEFIKLNAFKDYSKWSRFLTENNRSFAHLMYEYEGMDPLNRIKNFKIYRDQNLEDERFTMFQKNDYILVHDDPIRSFVIPSINFKNNVEKIDLNMRSDIIIDMLKVIENAKQLHFIDSSYSVLIHLLSFNNEKIRSIPKYLYTLNRNTRDIGIYQDPNAYNWTQVN